MAELIENLVNAITAQLDRGLGIESRADVMSREIDTLSPFLETFAKRQSVPQERLRDLFRLQAQRTGSLISSNFFVVPSSSAQDEFDSKSHQMENHVRNNSLYGYDFGVGFVSGGVRKNSFLVPVVSIDDSMLGRIENYKPEALLKSAAYLYSIGTHDYLHHLIPETFSSTVSKDSSNRDMHMRKIGKNYFGHIDDIETSCETFLIISHAKNFRGACAEIPAFKNKFTAVCDRILDEIKGITECMRDDGCAKKDISDFTNYFGSLSLFAMARVIDIEHDAVAQNFSRQITAFDPMTRKKQDSNKNILRLVSTFAGFEKEPCVRETLAMSERISKVMKAQHGAWKPYFVTRVEEIERKAIAAITQDITAALGPQASLN